MIVALAGRRIDVSGAEPPRFPEKNIILVKSRLNKFFNTGQVTAIVGSASCGTDLIALDIARELGIPVKIILPSDKETFKKTSVTDRPGNWGEVYEKIVGNHSPQSVVKELHLEDVNGSSYSAANAIIIEEAQQMAASQKSPLQVVALIVWEGGPKPESDYTAEFAQLAKSKGLEVREISTL